ncbi:hypothetical protein OESDEN_00471 [Oesophagostomum dentatum]|uniref:Leucine--tRNA ligase ubiquitin-like domain-containing protein n=1 Tax=Oesophagostomum dentatum TaxID=61180 RepID=A0A0B1TVS0_OESDE|nr:hypothetical protein OESDEN_00471 [Oesophagostomum dentatum]
MNRSASRFPARGNDELPCSMSSRKKNAFTAPPSETAEAAVLLENREYIESSMEFDRFSIKFTDEADVERIISETAVPWASLVRFFPPRECPCNKCSVDVNIEVMDGDLVAIVARKLRRLNKSIKHSVGGDRKMTNCPDQLAIHKKLEDSGEFKRFCESSYFFLAVITEKRTVFVRDNGKAYLIGDTVVYLAQ